MNHEKRITKKINFNITVIQLIQNMSCNYLFNY